LGWRFPLVTVGDMIIWTNILSSVPTASTTCCPDAISGLTSANPPTLLNLPVPGHRQPRDTAVPALYTPTWLRLSPYSPPSIMVVNASICVVPSAELATHTPCARPTAGDTASSDLAVSTSSMTVMEGETQPQAVRSQLGGNPGCQGDGDDILGVKKPRGLAKGTRMAIVDLAQHAGDGPGGGVGATEDVVHVQFQDRVRSFRGGGCRGRCRRVESRRRCRVHGDGEDRAMVGEVPQTMLVSFGT
ncbi:hypothetical protein Taro_013730, partial [Colocasia esculenta]|nr:hypothetical protein [Colocasia esculenta]